MAEPWSSEHGPDAGRAIPTPDVETLDRLLRAPARPFWSESWRERLPSPPGGAPRIAVVVAVLVLVAGLVGWRLWASDAAVSVVLPRAEGGTDAAAAATTTSSAAGAPGTDVSTSAPPAEVTVHVAGAVNAPGVVRVAGTARWADAVAAAGGAAPDAEVDRVNLAAPVTDGARLFVPRRGSDPPPVVAVEGAAGEGTTGVGTTGTGSAPTVKVDLNTATAEQLDTLPGVGPATAAAILQHREQQGPFRSIEELQDVSGIGPARFERLAPLVQVGS